MASVNVPTSWHQVTLRQFMALRELAGENGPADEKVYATISIMTGADPDEIRSWSMGTLDKVWTALDFLKHPERIGTKRKAPIKLLGKRFDVTSNPKRMAYGAWVDLMHFCKDEKVAEKNLHKSFACCLVERGRWPWSKSKPYDGKDHEAMAEAILDLPITTVKPHTDFFLRNYLRYSRRILIYLELLRRVTKRRADSMQFTAG